MVSEIQNSFIDNFVTCYKPEPNIINVDEQLFRANQDVLSRSAWLVSLISLASSFV